MGGDASLKKLSRYCDLRRILMSRRSRTTASVAVSIEGSTARRSQRTRTPCPRNSPSYLAHLFLHCSTDSLVQAKNLLRFGNKCLYEYEAGLYEG